jgi:serine/threonine protein kinase
MSGPDERSRVGTEFGPYRLTRLIGAGGMGETYEAEDTARGRMVALKLFPAASGDPEFRSWVLQLTQSVARLTEPHVVQIHGCGEIDGVLYIDMQLIDGTNLGTILQRYGPLNPPRAAAIIRQVASALDAARAKGLMHRDVKPENVLITGDDFAYLVDFGVTGPASREGNADVRKPISTYAYMAPERLAGDSVDYRSDIYSLACLLYQCLIGATPYRRDSVEAMINGHLRQPIPRPSAQRPGIPAAFDEVVARGMAKKPEDRYASGGDLARAAENALAPSDYGASRAFDDTEGAAYREHATGDMLKPTVETRAPRAQASGTEGREHATEDMLKPDVTEETETPTVVEVPLPPTTSPGSAATPAAAPEPSPTQAAERHEAAAAIDAPDELSAKQQLAIVLELRHALGRQTDDKERHEIRRLLRALRRRPEVTYAAVVQIDDILATDTDPHATPAVTGGPTPAEAPTTTYRLPTTDAPTAIVRMPAQRPRGAPDPTPPPQQAKRPPSWPPPGSSGPLPAQMGQPPMAPPPPGMAAGPPMYQPPSARSGARLWLAIAAVVLIVLGVAAVLIVVLS